MMHFIMGSNLTSHFKTPHRLRKVSKVLGLQGDLDDRVHVELHHLHILGMVVLEVGNDAGLTRYWLRQTRPKVFLKGTSSMGFT